MMKNHFSKTNTVLFHLYADLKKKDKTNKKACRYREEIGGCQRWGVGGRQKWMKGVKRYKLPVVKQMSPGISGQCYCAV